jgi:hypothetical protein
MMKPHCSYSVPERRSFAHTITVGNQHNPVCRVCLYVSNQAFDQINIGDKLNTKLVLEVEIILVKRSSSNCLPITNLHPTTKCQVKILQIVSCQVCGQLIPNLKVTCIWQGVFEGSDKLWKTKSQASSEAVFPGRFSFSFVAPPPRALLLIRINL